MYNHYFTNNLQKQREDQLIKNLDVSLYSFLGIDPTDKNIESWMYNGEFDVYGLYNTLKQETQKNMKCFATIEASNTMFAYYKVRSPYCAMTKANQTQVALKRIIDTFTIDTMNEFLIDKLASLFLPQIVSKLDGNVVTRVARESKQSIEEQMVLDKKLATLREAQKIGYHIHRHKPQGKSTPQDLTTINTILALTICYQLFEDLVDKESYIL